MAESQGPQRTGFECGSPLVMASPRFFAAMPLQQGDVGASSTLPEPVVHHALRVLRLAVGDSMTLFTGQGGEYAPRSTRAGKRDAWARVDAFVPEERESTLAVTLVQARSRATDGRDRAPRGRARRCRRTAGRDRAQCALSGGAQGTGRLAHWRQIVVAACEQCGRNRVPRCARSCRCARWLDARGAGASGIVLDRGSQRRDSRRCPRLSTRSISGGPEGGLNFGRGRACAARRARRCAAGAATLRADTHRSRRSPR